MTRIQEIARFRTIEFLVEQAAAIGVGHPTIVARLNDALLTIRQCVSDLPVDGSDVI